MHDTLIQTAGTVDIVDLVDVDSYPIHRPTSDRLRRVVDQARVRLASTGCLKLPGLVRPSMLRRLSAETNRVAPDAYTTVRQITPYGDDGTGHDDIPKDHPRRWAGTWSNGFVGKDRIPADSLIRILYDDEHFRTFIADCLGLDKLHQFCDPIAVSWST